jgi:hypothetical protein
MKHLQSKWSHLTQEPPFRRLTKAFLKVTTNEPFVRARWDISRKPQYLLGITEAAKQAIFEGISSISAIEFGVAGGAGLLVMQEEAEVVSQKTGIDIRVYGFDMGTGLPQLIGDYRDHPDIWNPGDYPMNEAALRQKLSPRTRLILGNVEQTVGQLLEPPGIPSLGFVSIDVDLYSSTRAALNVFRAAGRKMLLHVPMYFDDVDMFYTHSKGGELLAMKEFNDEQHDVFIDQWRGIKAFRPFPEAPYLDRFFIAHDLKRISEFRRERAAQVLPVEMH